MKVSRQPTAAGVSPHYPTGLPRFYRGNSSAPKTAWILLLSFALLARGNAATNPPTVVDNNQDFPGLSDPDSASSTNKTKTTGASQPNKPETWWAAIKQPKGGLNPTMYRRLASKGDEKTMNFLLGPDATAYYGRKGALPREKVPERPLLDSGKLRGQYSFGTAGGPPGRYWFTEGQVLYVPDPPGLPGIDRIICSDYGRDSLSVHPKITVFGKGRPDQNTRTKEWLDLVHNDLEAPVAIARSQTTANICEIGYVAFRSGLVGGFGVMNQRKTPHLLFPKNKVPMALAMSARSEFLFVAVWDTKEIRSQIAVIALGGSGNDKTMYGTPNSGRISLMKLLGYIDLPDIQAPTALVVGGNRNGSANFSPFEYALELQEKRDRHQASRQAFWSSGFLVVAAKFEDKVAFIDLQPLFEGFIKMYTGDQAKFDQSQKTGPEPDRWPYTFEHTPSMKPKLLTVRTVPSPTALWASEYPGEDRPGLAAVACLDGRLLIYQVGNLATDQPATASDIKPFGTAKLGKNPCSLTQTRVRDETRPTQKHRQFGPHTLLACSRGDACLQWIEIGTSGKVEVYRTIRDQRLEDPVSITAIRTNSENGANVVATCDFRGKRVLQYRVGPAHVLGTTYPVEHQGFDYEFVGSLDIPGYPFTLSADNVPSRCVK